MIQMKCNYEFFKLLFRLSYRHRMNKVKIPCFIIFVSRKCPLIFCEELNIYSVILIPCRTVQQYIFLFLSPFHQLIVHLIRRSLGLNSHSNEIYPWERKKIGHHNLLGDIWLLDVIAIICLSWRNSEK